LLGFSIKSENVETNRGKKRKKQKKKDPTLENKKKQTQKKI
jgi:hypothetical protein